MLEVRTCLKVHGKLITTRLSFPEDEVVNISALFSVVFDQRVVSCRLHTGASGVYGFSRQRASIGWGE
jgi:hypothetical protein